MVAGTKTEGVHVLVGAKDLAEIAKIWHWQADRGTSKKSREARWERVWTQVAWAALKGNPDNELPREAREGFEQSLVDEVRGPDDTITDLFREIVSLKKADRHLHDASCVAIVEQIDGRSAFGAGRAGRVNVLLQPDGASAGHWAHQSARSRRKNPSWGRSGPNYLSMPDSATLAGIRLESYG